MLVRILAKTPDKDPAPEVLTLLRERQGKSKGRSGPRQKLYALRSPTAAELTLTGIMQMGARTGRCSHRVVRESTCSVWIGVPHDTELGVL
jgi:hypothetical protein